MTALRATVRLQLHRDFGLDAAAAQVPYFSTLGISHVYLSPIATARAGSLHGYDAIDPLHVSAELGGEEALHRLVAALRAHAMGAILDIVPNHVAADVANPWWRDVLARGQQSTFARFFDIDWDAPQARNRLVLPILDGPPEQALADRKLQLACNPQGEPVTLESAGQPLPLSDDSLCWLVGEAGGPTDEIRSRASALAACARLLTPEAEGALAATVARLNASPAALQHVLDLQHYELLDWRQANGRVNYRRFFDINGLAALAMERRQVFDAVHALPLRLIAEGLVDGLRIDHVDGLSMPGDYLGRLRRAVDEAARERPPELSDAITIHVEKILARGEFLPDGWPVDGTTGYDFMAEVDALLHDPIGASPLQAAWARLSGVDTDFERDERVARAGVLAQNLSSEWSRCARSWADAIGGEAVPQASGTPTAPALRGAIGQVLQSLRVYRSYLADGAGAGAGALAAAFDQAQQVDGEPFAATRMQLRELLLGRDDARPSLVREASRRLEQTAAALNAKAVEDTCFYRYGVLLSRNEVGSDPRQFACSPDVFHAAMEQRTQHWPRSLLATATHDHKRGEDTRARLAALSARADEYVVHATAWLQELRTIDPAPAPTDLWMLLQTIVAAWPLELATETGRGPDLAARQDFASRIEQWQQKALREAGEHTSWLEPSPVYEAACQHVTRALLLDDGGAALRARIGAWAHSLDTAGALLGLAAVTLRCTVPGVPDLYQGTEYWDQSLVDPDNRRAVDYSQRQATLDDAIAPQALLRGFRDGRIKQRVIRDLLRVRARHPALFAGGDYTPLQVADSAVPMLAFTRRQDDERLLVVVPLRFAPRGSAMPSGRVSEAALATTRPGPLLPTDALRDALVMPGEAAADAVTGAWQDVFAGSMHRAVDGTLALAPLLDGWPVAVLLAASPGSGRSSGEPVPSR